jgi:tRNA pseudouridine55 synthase
MAAPVSKPALTGVLLVDKPGRMTSHDVVGRVRRIFGQREVGHTGTLDPMATGLLVLTLGRATRIGRFLEASDKRYLGTITLGCATTTFDRDGEPTETMSIDRLREKIDRARVEEALRSLVGARMQKAPPFSAIKVDGERLYARARRGERVEAPEREVRIFELALRRFDLPDVEIEAHVSKGTYIRSLAVELGERLGAPAHLSMLRRTEVGVHDVKDARGLDALEGDARELMRMEDALAHLPRIVVDPARAKDVVHGRVLSAEAVRTLASGAIAFEAGAPILLLSEASELLAIGETVMSSADLPSAAANARAIGYACVLARPPR